MKRTALFTALVALCLTLVIGMAARPPYHSSADLLQFLPDGSGVVVVDFQKVIASSVWSSGQKGIKGTIDKVQHGTADLINPADIQMMAVAIQGFDFNNPVAIATGTFNQTDLLARLKADQNLKLSTEKYKSFDLHNVSHLPASGSRGDVSFSFYDSATVIVGKAAGVREAIDTKLGEKPSIARNARLTDALAGLPPSAIRFALAPTAAMTSGLQSSDVPLPDFSSISLIFGSVDLASSLELTAFLRSDTGEHARLIADRLNGLLSMARGFLAGNEKLAPAVEALKTVTITSSDVDVKITGSVSADVLNGLLGANRKS
jgi:hypothetical protein